MSAEATIFRKTLAAARTTVVNAPSDIGVALAEAFCRGVIACAVEQGIIEAREWMEHEADVARTGDARRAQLRNARLAHGRAA